MPTDTDNYELIIQPSRGLLRIDWHGLLHYRDLLFLLVRRDFVAQYKQTILGPLWFIKKAFLGAGEASRYLQGCPMYNAAFVTHGTNSVFESGEDVCGYRVRQK